jgi:uncharacterized membrane protein YphA (DoxX/SURF4 family)
MNNLDWFAQILLAGIFLFFGLSKILATQRQKRAPQANATWNGAGLPRTTACAIALVEILCALALVVPVRSWRPDLPPLLAAAGLALLLLAACTYHIRRREHAGLSVALFLLALFVVIGHV